MTEDTNLNMKNNVTLNTDKVIDGVMLAINALRPTYGPYGVNAVIACEEAPYTKVVNDAKTIVDAIESKDKEEKLGLFIYKELMDKQDLLSGDGRKTTALIAGELITLGRKLDMPKVKLKKELDALIPVIEAKIDLQKRQITVDDVSAVATVASESEEIGALLGDIYKQIGKDGIIHLEGSGTPKTHYKVTDGVRFTDATYLASSMVYDEQAVKEGKTPTRAIYENPTILVTKKKINSLGEINPLLLTLVGQGVKSLVIFTDDMDTDVATSLIRVHKSGEIRILIIKAPVIWKEYVFEDFAKCVGATIVDVGSGIDLKKLPLSALGTCGTIITDAKETIILGTKDISEHIEALKEEGSIDSKHRLSWLVTKTCNLYLGANSEGDLYYKTMKCKDAINASRLALQDGVVKGGGLCLGEMIINGDITMGIMRDALRAPLIQLMKNAGIPDIKDYDKYLASIGKDVVDSSMVLKNAVRSAIGLASTTLTAGVTIPFLEKTQEELALLNSTKKMF